MNYSAIQSELARLGETSNLRKIPSAAAPGMVDFTSNDYLGIARRDDWQSQFLAETPRQELALTSSASRLLADNQNPYLRLERKLELLYGREALLFNSGYHANTGIISALADKRTLILADRLVHASIIDGIMLSKCDFTRFYHDDYGHLQRLIERNIDKYETILVVVESVYSMDGDISSIDSLIDIKRQYDKVMLYVDEAHAFGCMGPMGLGLCLQSADFSMVDVVVGTFGKAAASQGAFAIVDSDLKQYLINKARSFIFSTAIPPISASWTSYVVDKIVDMDAERAHLASLAQRMKSGFGSLAADSKFAQGSATAIQPFVIGNSSDTLRLSALLADDGVKVLPIRTPTVPPGTERLRFSLSAALTEADVDLALRSLKNKFEKL